MLYKISCSIIQTALVICFLLNIFLPYAFCSYRVFLIAFSCAYTTAINFEDECKTLNLLSYIVEINSTFLNYSFKYILYCIARNFACVKHEKKKSFLINDYVYLKTFVFSSMHHIFMTTHY